MRFRAERRRGVGLGLAVALALAPGCKKRPGPAFAVDRFQISEESLAAYPALGTGPEGLQKLVQEALVRQGAQVVRQGQAAGEVRVYRLRAEVEYAREAEAGWADGGAGKREEVALALELVPTQGDRSQRLVGPGLGAVPAPQSPEPDAQGAAYQKALRAAVEAAAAALVRGALAQAKDSAALEADLQSPDAGVREAAADVLVDRHDASATPVLLEELSAEDDRVRMKAVGQLVELKARAAVPKLIDLAQAEPGRDSDPHLQVQVIYALGSIGGEEAEAYLYTLSTGHPDEGVRRAAREAAAELKAAKARAGAGTSAEAAPDAPDAARATAGRTP